MGVETMPKNVISKQEIFNKGWDVIQKIAVAGVIALSAFCFKMNREINSITNNARDILILRKEHNEDKTALWRKYSDLHTSVESLSREVSENKTSIQFLIKNP